MHPVIFTIGSIPVHTYYILWTAALSLAVLWTRRRAVLSYGYTMEEASSVLLWGLLGLYIGARAGGVWDHWEYFSAEPWKMLYVWEGGLGAVPAFFGAGFAAIWRIKRLGRGVSAFAEAASLPAAATVMVGRWGCFFNGCCYGVPTTSILGVHFPFDPQGLLRLPTQLFYSAGAGVLLLLLLLLERSRWYRGNPTGQAILWPLFMAGYGCNRLIIDHFRAEYYDLALSSGKVFGSISLAVGLLWLFASLYKRGRSAGRA
ncbi:MAG: prolipoprotein diacylglyceryl transferase [Synergistales bacterium]|nr:prolipoprotein diacylglyceryl transferase [Synergistales bacterium]